MWLLVGEMYCEISVPVDCAPCSLDFRMRLRLLLIGSGNPSWLSIAGAWKQHFSLREMEGGNSDAGDGFMLSLLSLSLSFYLQQLNILNNRGLWISKTTTFSFHRIICIFIQPEWKTYINSNTSYGFIFSSYWGDHVNYTARETSSNT